MTDEEIQELKDSFAANPLYQKSVSLMKDYQLMQFSDENFNELNGQQIKPCEINGIEMVVIFHFKNGFLNSEDNKPAVEYPNHWEYWKSGIVERVVDVNEDVEEFWEEGVPVRIEKYDRNK